MASNYPNVIPGLTPNELLSAPVLTGMVEQIKTGIYNPYPASMFKPKDDTSKISGNQGRYTITYGQRQTSRTSAKGSPSTNVQRLPLSQRDAILVTISENYQFEMDQYLSLFKFDSLEKQKLGIQEITRQLEGFKQRSTNLRIATVGQLLFAGQLGFDIGGNLLANNVTSTSGTTVTFGIPNGGTVAGGQVPINPYSTTVGTQIGAGIDPFGTGIPILGSNVGGTGVGTWSNQTTNIMQQIRNLLQASVKLTGWEVTDAWYGKNIPQYLITNNTTEYYFARNQRINDAVMTNMLDIPDGTLDIARWHDCSKAYFYDQNNTVQQICGDNQITFTIEPASGWYDFMVGSGAVPDQGQKVYNGDTPAQVIGMAEEMFGLRAYSYFIPDPATAKIVMGDDFLPVPRNPQGLFIATVA